MKKLLIILFFLASVIVYSEDDKYLKAIAIETDYYYNDVNKSGFDLCFSLYGTKNMRLYNFEELFRLQFNKHGDVFSMGFRFVNILYDQIMDDWYDTDYKFKTSIKILNSDVYALKKEHTFFEFGHLLDVLDLKYERNIETPFYYIEDRVEYGINFGASVFYKHIDYKNSFYDKYIKGLGFAIKNVNHINFTNFILTIGEEYSNYSNLSQFSDFELLSFSAQLIYIPIKLEDYLGRNWFWMNKKLYFFVDYKNSFILQNGLNYQTLKAGVKYEEFLYDIKKLITR